MLIQQISGHSRLTAFFIIILLTLCVTAASAASLNIYPVYSQVTQTYQIATTITPALATCPAGYDCMTDADAAAQLGTYARYSDAVCGYKQNTATLAAVIHTPQYCVKKVETQYPGICPDGCSCMIEATARDKFQGGYKQCSEKPCYSVVTAAAQVNAYCFRPGTTTTTSAVTCDPGCDCISTATAESRAKDAGGTYARCKPDICGYEQSTATLAAVVNVPKYCIKLQKTTAVCPDGCSCFSESDAKLKGLTKCDPDESPCGYQTSPAATAANKVALYCYRTGSTVTSTPQVCPEGCYCVQEADVKEKLGPNNYTRCDTSGKPCGYDPSATTANGIPRYCFRPAVTVTLTPAVCPQGCVCTTDETARIKGLAPCRGTRTSCGCDNNRQPLYCFEQVPYPTCVYDYQKNTCTGTCQQGASCGLLASRKDATGKVDYAVCGCTGQPAGQCTFDKEKQTCAGTCQSGAGCAIVGREINDNTGEINVVCGCPESSCTYNYDKNACAGTCTATGEVCQLNTIYRDPATGKVTYADCHCKEGGDTTRTCTCDPASSACTGTCTDGKACTMVEQTADNAGKVTCARCECRDTCVLDASNRCSGTCANQQPCSQIVSKDESGQEKVSCGCGGAEGGTPVGTATRQPGILEAIGNFFSRLFGGK